jgi:hypothetical protein
MAVTDPISLHAIVDAIDEVLTSLRARGDNEVLDALIRTMEGIRANVTTQCPHGGQDQYLMYLPAESQD